MRRPPKVPAGAAEAGSADRRVPKPCVAGSSPPGASSPASRRPLAGSPGQDGITEGRREGTARYPPDTLRNDTSSTASLVEPSHHGRGQRGLTNRRGSPDAAAFPPRAGSAVGPKPPLEQAIRSPCAAGWQCEAAAHQMVPDTAAKVVLADANVGKPQDDAREDAHLHLIRAPDGNVHYLSV
jgi:hypothetical protein